MVAPTRAAAAADAAGCGTAARRRGRDSSASPCGGGRVEMADVDRIERAAEDADAHVRRSFDRVPGRRSPASRRVALRADARARAARHTASSSAARPRRSPPTPGRAACRARRTWLCRRASRSGSSSASILFARDEIGLSGEPLAGCVAARKQRQLARDDVEVLDRVAPARRRHVHDVHQHFGPLEMAAETDGPARARRARLRSVRARRRRRSCARPESPTTPRFGVERGERIVGDLRPRGGDARDHRRLAGVREADQPDVGQQLQLRAEILLLAGQARLDVARRAVGRGGEARVAAAAEAALARSARAGRLRSGRRPDCSVPSSSLRRRRPCRSAPAARCRCPFLPVRFEPSPCPPRSASKIFWKR